MTCHNSVPIPPSDQLDKCYISLRNGCRDDRLSLAARYRLLEVIELRAMHWQANENLINYYKQKLVQIEVRLSLSVAMLGLGVEMIRALKMS